MCPLPIDHYNYDYYDIFITYLLLPSAFKDKPQPSCSETKKAFKEILVTVNESDCEPYLYELVIL